MVPTDDENSAPGRAPVGAVTRRPPFPQPAWLLLAILFGAVLAAYLPVWQAGFIWDDDAHVTEVPSIVGHAGLAEIWTSAAANYFPLTTSTFWLIHALWGLNPVAYHVIDVMMHAADAVLLWLVLRQLRVRGAWLGAMLWALHPVQVESAAWITETKNTQSGVFYLLAILSFLRWASGPEGPVNRRRLWYYGAAWLCAVLAILSKSSTVMLPVVLGLCWWWKSDRWRWHWILWLLPFAAISAVAAGWTIWEQKFHSGALGPDWNLSWPQRVIVAGYDVWFYVGKLLWPQPLIMIYPRWMPDQASLASYLPALAAAGVLLFLWWQRRRLRPWFFATAYFGVSLFPVLGFFNVYFYRFSYVADHFQYLADMGALALAGAGLATVGDWLDRWHPRFALPLGSLVLVGLGFLSWSHCQAFRNDDTLWRATLADNPEAWLAHYNLAVMLEHQPGRMPEAIAHYEATLRLYPGHWKAHANLGNVFLRIPGRMPDATAHYEAALRINPDLAEPEDNLGNILMSEGRLAEAIPHFEAAIRIDPKFAVAHFNLANALRDLPGRMPEVIAHYEAAARIKPDWAEAQYNLGIALLDNPARQPEAIAHLETALRIRPDLSMAREIVNKYRGIPTP